MTNPSPSFVLGPFRGSRVVNRVRVGSVDDRFGLGNHPSVLGFQGSPV